MVADPIVGGDCRSYWRFIFVGACELIIGDGHALDVMRAGLRHQRSKHARIDSAGKEYAHRNVGHQVPGN